MMDKTTMAMIPTQQIQPAFSVPSIVVILVEP